MPLPQNVINRLQQVLSAVAEDHPHGARLKDDAARLWDRVQKFIALQLLGGAVDAESLELSCYALQLPLRQAKGAATGILGRTNLRERCEQAAELLVSLVGQEIEEPLLDRAARLLHEVPQRATVIDDARLLADALNLDDFGLTGAIVQAIQLGS